jgi:hypothetical protein
MIKYINRLIGVIIDTLRQYRLISVWLLLTANLLIQWGVLAALNNFMSPLLFKPVMAFVNLVGDQYAAGFSHYPGHYMILPYVFDWAKFIIGVILEGLILGGVALLMYEDHFDTPSGERTPLKAVIGSWLHLSVAWALLNGMMLVISLGLPSLFESWMTGSPRRIMAYQFGLVPIIYLFLIGLQFFVIPRIAIFGENVLRALKGSVIVFVRNPISCLILAFIVLLGPWVVSFFTGQPAVIVEKFQPELVYWMLVVGLFVEMLANFLWIGSAARFLVELEE